MRNRSRLFRYAHSLIIAGVSGSAMVWGTAAFAQTADRDKPASSTPVSAGEQSSSSDQDIVVTGSRIKRATSESSSPVSTIDAQTLTDRGYVQAGQALNLVPSIVPSTPIASGSGSAAGGGQQYPNLFGLGPARTLTLVNGHRFVTSASGTGDQLVDTNMIPVGLLDSVDIVEGGGAAVYGSDAIAGVVNYKLKDHFKGLELDAQSGISSRGDYPQTSLRATWGSDFASGRGNIAIDAEWSKTGSLFWSDRPATNPPFIVGRTNPLNTSATDGQPALLGIPDVRFWEWNYNGLVFSIPAPFTQFLASPTPQFAPDGQSLQAYNPGSNVDIPFASGGQGFSYGDLSALYSGVERKTVNAIGHFDLTDRLKFSAGFLFGRTRGTDPYGSQGAVHDILDTSASGAGPIVFFANNPYLSAQARATLIASNPSFGAGAPLFLSKQFGDLLPTRAFVTTTDSYRGYGSLDGDFQLGEHHLYYSVFYSHGETTGRVSGWGVNNARFNASAQAVRNTAGQIVCGINADANAANDDPACVPLNIFGASGTSDAARSYLVVPVGSSYRNIQDDAVATLGGDLISLPAGMAKFSIGYEHRNEKARFTPDDANRLGLTGAGLKELPSAGAYNTDEFSAELLVPLVGGDFTLPLVRRLEVEGQFRHVDNSLAGGENVWGMSARWEVVSGLTIRGSRSRNFRAPTLDQLLAPAVTKLTVAGTDPCDKRFVDTGPNPAVRRANCVAVFAAHPTYNGGTGSIVGYQDNNSNFDSSLVTSGGNPNLRNEISTTTTYGVLFQPRFIPGLTIAADRIEIDLRDGLSAFTPTQFEAACFDSAGMPASVCNTFTRNANGDIVTGTATTFNAGSVRYRGETYKLNYARALGGKLGTIELGVEANHIASLVTSVTGSDFTRSEGTTVAPRWTARFDLAWSKGPFRLSYQAVYLSSARIRSTDTIETTPYPIVPSNLRHDLSMLIDVDRFQFRVGVTNLTDKGPSFPTLNYGDILGRRFFAGTRIKF